MSDAREPNSGAVALLRDVLARAESGETVGVAIVEEFANGSIGTSFVGRSYVALLGAVQILADRITNSFRSC